MTSPGGSSERRLVDRSNIVCKNPADETLQLFDDGFMGRLQDRKSLEELQPTAEDFFEVKQGVLGRRGRQDHVSAARAVYCFLAVVKLHYPGVEAGSKGIL